MDEELGIPRVQQFAKDSPDHVWQSYHLYACLTTKCVSLAAVPYPVSLRQTDLFTLIGVKYII